MPRKSLTAVGQDIVVDLSKLFNGGIGIQLGGVSSFTTVDIRPEITRNDDDWAPIAVEPDASPGTYVTSLDALGSWWINVVGCKKFRVRVEDITGADPVADIAVIFNEG